MKKLSFLLLVIFTGCVRYYAPQTAFENGVYYAEDDPAYVDASGAYNVVTYYPWGSLDYFYLAYYPYRYYGHISSWYVSHYDDAFHYNHMPYYAACTDEGGCPHKNKKHRRERKFDRYAGRDHDVMASGSGARRSDHRSQRAPAMSSSSRNKMSKSTARRDRE